MCAKDAKTVTAVSTPFAELLAKRLKVNVEVISNIVDKYFIPTTIKTKNLEFNFLNIAGFNKNKNQRLLIDAFTDGFKDKDNVFLRIGGYGVLEDELKDLVKEYSMEDRIIFLGSLTQERVKEEMDSADCFVLSSNYETFGVVLIESLACGTPVIATKCGGPEDIVDEKNGILIGIGDKRALKEAMQYMYENKNRYDRKLLSDATIERFGEKAFVDRVTALYNRAVKDKI
jgi:glycosyltransferase involved in cell wall biosynthesis